MLRAACGAMSSSATAAVSMPAAVRGRSPVFSDGLLVDTVISPGCVELDCRSVVARATSSLPARWVEAISTWSGAGAALESSRALRMRRPLGLMPRSRSALISRPATPETIAVAKLVPVARHSPPPTQAPGTLLPGAMTPCARCPGPQLLDSSGLPVSLCAPTANTPATEAGMVSQAQPWLPAAATTSASQLAAACRASLRACESDNRSVCWEALILMMLACRSSAVRMPAASSS